MLSNYTKDTDCDVATEPSRSATTHAYQKSIKIEFPLTVMDLRHYIFGYPNPEFIE